MEKKTWKTEKRRKSKRDVGRRERDESQGKGRGENDGIGEML